jgi:hypothetical protein
VTLLSSATGVEALDSLILRAVDELHDDGTLTDATWAGLAAQFDDNTILESIALVGFYHLVSFLVSAVGVEDHSPGAGPLLLSAHRSRRSAGARERTRSAR